MNATDVLKQEHRGIEIMLSIPERMCRKLKKTMCFSRWLK